MVQPLCPRATQSAESRPGDQIQACVEFTSETSHPSQLPSWDCSRTPLEGHFPVWGSCLHDGITDSMDMSLSRLRELVMDRGGLECFREPT